jgi:F0F1-type ATP synthase membrane subunit c/vacuolar-type H+-ATPase subunit K
MHVHNEDRFAGIPRLRESKQIGEVEAGIPVGEAKVGAGIMVGHSFSSFLAGIEIQRRISEADFWSADYTLLETETG